MSEDYNLYPLHIFRLVAQLGSVTRAAQELFISQPAVSAHLRTLETHYGELLFERTPRGMTLTTAGEALYQKVGELFVLYEGLSTAIDDTRGKVTGEIVVAASSVPGAYLVPARLSEFQQAYPEAKPILKVGDSAEVLAWLHDYRVPVGIIGEMSLTDDLERVEIGSDKLQLVTVAGDPLGRSREIKAAHLRGRTLFVREHSSSTRAGTDELLGDLVEAVERMVEINNTEAIKQSVVAGLGIAVLSSLTMKLEEETGVLTPVRDARLRRARKFYAVKRKDRQLTGGAAAIWKFLVAGRKK